VSDELEKDELTARVRLRLCGIDGLREDPGRAEAGLTTLAFRSADDARRNVWIDTDLGGRIAVDLEDFTDESEWDNAVVRLSVDDEQALVSVVRAWLGGGDVESAVAAGGEATRRR